MILATTTPATATGTEAPRTAGTVVPPTTAIAMAIAGNQRGRATATMMRAHSAAGQVIARALTRIVTHGIAVRTRAGPIEGETAVSGMSIRVTCSHGTWTCHAAWSARIVRDRDREYTLRGSESRTLATVGSFRVVSSRDLRDHNDRPAEPRAGDLRHLREQKLIETIPVPGYRDHAVVLTKEGRSLLEHHRDRDHEPRQTFYSGLKRERELEHDLMRLVFPRPLDRFYDAYQTVIREELETPLHPATISELKWYFQHRRAAGHGPVHPQTQGFLDVGAKVFGSPPLIRLYRRWLRRGDAVFEAVSSPAIADALAAGTACIESLVLPHAYRHLFPLVAEKHPSSGVEKWDEGGDETSARP